tara:strand:+ start:637 stop:804 length:168 start_codon:yes stop_codon:yes gene_type:complete
MCRLHGLPHDNHCLSDCGRFGHAGQFADFADFADFAVIGERQLRVLLLIDWSDRF